jgi:hypothetical protein
VLAGVLVKERSPKIVDRNEATLSVGLTSSKCGDLETGKRKI